MRKQWSTSPNVRGLPEDYPIDETHADVSPLMFNGVGGSMLIFAGAWPRMLPSDFRVRSLDGVADDWPLTTTSCSRTTSAPTATSACRGWAATRPTRPAARIRRCRRCRSGGRAQGRPGARRGSAGTGGRSPTRSCPPRTTAAGRASSAARASRAATRAPRRRPTSPTGRRRSRSARRSITGARVRRIETNAAGPRDRRHLDRPRRQRALRAGEGRRPRRERDRHAPAAAPLGRRRATPTASRTRPGSSASG